MAELGAVEHVLPGQGRELHPTMTFVPAPSGAKVALDIEMRSFLPCVSTTSLEMMRSLATMS
jgi:hypothetical protein